MAFMVVCAGGPVFTQRHRLWECRYETWDQIRALARWHGWAPEGTTPDPIWADWWEKCEFDPSYECEDFGKMVSDSDAHSLADALDRALKGSKENWPAIGADPRPMLLSDSMDDRQLMRANRGPDPALVKELILFLRKGWFSFCWDE